MRKLIMMAVAGFIWKKVQARLLKPSSAVRAPTRY